MTVIQECKGSFVLVHIGEHRFAVDANLVVEMSPPVRLHKFPHTSRLVSGVIVRRSKIVPVLNANAIFKAHKPLSNVFYLIAEFARSSELMAIPVNGESELSSGDPQAADETAPEYISGFLRAGSDSVPVLNLEVLANSLKNAEARAESEAHQ